MDDSAFGLAMAPGGAVTDGAGHVGHLVLGTLHEEAVAHQVIVARGGRRVRRPSKAPEPGSSAAGAARGPYEKVT